MTSMAESAPSPFDKLKVRTADMDERVEGTE